MCRNVTRKLQKSNYKNKFSEVNWIKKIAQSKLQKANCTMLMAQKYFTKKTININYQNELHRANQKGNYTKQVAQINFESKFLKANCIKKFIQNKFHKKAKKRNC